MTITAVSTSGVPLLSEKAAVVFRTTYGILGRERVPITTQKCKDLTTIEKAQLWTEITTSFDIPVEFSNLVRRQAFLSMGHA